MKKIIIQIVVLLIFTMANHTMAMVEDSYVYIFHLYYDGQTLTKDRDYKEEYEIAVENLEKREADKLGFYGELMSAKGESLRAFYVQPLAVGKTEVRVSYDPSAEKAVFFGAGGKKLYTVDVSGSVICKIDGYCFDTAGENYKNCPEDCKTEAIEMPDIVADPNDVESPQETDEGVGVRYFIIAGAVILVGLAGGLLFLMNRAGTKGS
jgi:hypothetical protein